MPRKRYAARVGVGRRRETTGWVGTLRFLLTARAGRLTRVGGRHVLRLARNPATGALYARIQHTLAA